MNLIIPCDRVDEMVIGGKWCIVTTTRGQKVEGYATAGDKAVDLVNDDSTVKHHVPWRNIDTLEVE